MGSLLSGTLTIPSISATELVVALRPIAPYVMVDAQGRVSGLEYEILQAAFATRGYTVRPVLMPLARLVETFKSRKVDAAAPVLASHNAGGTLSDSYLTYRNVAATLRDSPLPLKTVSDLRGLTIAAFQTATKVLGPEFARAVAGNPLYVEEAQQVTQVRLLFSGRVQVIIGDSRILQSLARAPESDLRRSGELLEYPLFAPTLYSVAFQDPQRAAEFNAGLALIKANGVYARLLSKYR